MSTQHPITPPPELVAKLWRISCQCRDDAPIGEIFNHGVYLAYSAGADQELDACCEWVTMETMESGVHLRSARRPNPPSLKEQALGALGRFHTNAHTRADEMAQDFDLIRRALEALND